MSFEGMDVLHRAGNISYGLLLSEGAVDDINIELSPIVSVGFSYFHNKFGMPYDFLLKCSIDSGHSLFVAVDEKERLLGFARFEDIGNVSRSARQDQNKNKIVEHSFCLLRSIEVHSSYRHIGIGRLLFAVAVGHLQSNIMARPDNIEAARFFRNKLRFGDMGNAGCSISPRYKDYLMLPYPKSKSLLKVLAKNYPRMVLPELVDLYESLKFKSNMGKKISKNDILRLKDDYHNSGHLLDRNLSSEIMSMIVKFNNECEVHQQ